MTLNRVILATGGTGGHIFPALAVADELKSRNPGVEFLFMGGSGPEGDLARGHGLEFAELPAKGVMGRGLTGVLGGAAWVAKALPKAMSKVRAFGPDVAIGFGGYAGFCPILAASLLKIPTAVHEQNSVPGMTNKFLGGRVRRVFLSFPDYYKVFAPSKIDVVGNPVRADIVATAERREGRTPGKRLLVLGGSQGAKPVNDAIIEAVPVLLREDVVVVHQAGKRDEDRVRTAYEKAGADGERVHGFIDDMASEYVQADLVVCRSGASTVFEIAAAGVPAVFTPFPQATYDHQTVNAKAMVDAGGGVLVPQHEHMAGELVEMVLHLLGDAERLTEMGRAARGFAKPNAVKDIASGLEALAA